jgi:hypothetical protein
MAFDCTKGYTSRNETPSRLILSVLRDRDTVRGYGVAVEDSDMRERLGWRVGIVWFVVIGSGVWKDVKPDCVELTVRLSEGGLPRA